MKTIQWKHFFAASKKTMTKPQILKRSKFGLLDTLGVTQSKSEPSILLMVKAYKLPMSADQKNLSDIEQVSRVFQVICRKFVKVFGKRGMTFVIDTWAFFQSVWSAFLRFNRIKVAAVTASNPRTMTCEAGSEWVSPSIYRPCRS